jgi:hypothetical protein
MNIDNKFLDWCIEQVCSNLDYSLRGVFFFVIGLLSRTARGSRKLLLLSWDSAPLGCNSAVAVPRDPSSLFQFAKPTFEPIDKKDAEGFVNSSILGGIFLFLFNSRILYLF